MNTFYIQNLELWTKDADIKNTDFSFVLVELIFYYGLKCQMINYTTKYVVIDSGKEFELVWGSKTCYELKNIQSEIWRVNIIRKNMEFGDRVGRKE